MFHKVECITLVTYLQQIPQRKKTVLNRIIFLKHFTEQRDILIFLIFLTYISNYNIFVSVNLNGAGRVDMSHFELLRVLGTGGKFLLVFLFFFLAFLIGDEGFHGRRVFE